MSELRGRTEEANALAVWIRKITAGVQVRVLAETFPYSKSVWSEYRNGAKLIPEQLLDDVVDKLVADTELRERQRAEGRRLLDAAQKAVRRRPTGRPARREQTGLPDRPSMPAGVADVLLRLDDARLQQIEAMRKLADSEKRCSQLQEMVSVLQTQCAQLTDERDHARVEAREARELQVALEQSEAYRAQAEGQLQHARKASEQAFELRLAAEAKVMRAQAEARRTTGAPPGAGSLLPQPAGIGLDLPPLERIGEVLKAVRDQLAEQDEELDELRSHLGVAEPVAEDSGAPRVITGHVIARQSDRPGDDAIVRDDSADNMNNPVTSADITPAAGPSVIVRACTAAMSPADLGRVLDMLRVRAGVRDWSIGRMTAKANAGRLAGESPYTDISLGGWLDGSRFPKQPWGLDALVSALGAAEEERTAFLSSYWAVSRREAEAFKEAYPRITRHGDESFEAASSRVAEEEGRRAREAADAQAAREASERAEQAAQEREARREAKRAQARMNRERLQARREAEEAVLRKLRREAEEARERRELEEAHARREAEEAAAQEANEEVRARGSFIARAEQIPSIMAQVLRELRSKPRALPESDRPE
ncbi:hypothetical protein [Streptomyces sp. NPDC047981]|uniref:hypothetical protein n=1 Tax=Streptomyces sp. NPDC047981 TaxID=3154610 RepID=UPI00343AE0E5